MDINDKRHICRGMSIGDNEDLPEAIVESWRQKRQIYTNLGLTGEALHPDTIVRIIEDGDGLAYAAELKEKRKREKELARQLSEGNGKPKDEADLPPLRRYKTWGDVAEGEVVFGLIGDRPQKARVVGTFGHDKISVETKEGDLKRVAHADVEPQGFMVIEDIPEEEEELTPVG